MSASDSVFIETPARLHFGVLDLRGSLGRRFGGLGAAIAEPSLLLEARLAPDVIAEGPDADRAAHYARRYLAHYRLSEGAHLRVHRAIPSHAGLGSGTQLGLAVARALAELYQRPTEPAALAQAVGRGRRSAIGTWVFALGGFILEGGRRPGVDCVAPLLTRLPIPPTWRYVVALPPGTPGLSGDAEAAAFERLPAPPESDVEQIAHLVLMQLLPALVDADLPAFGAALSMIQRITGGWFAAAQGDNFASPIGRAVIERMAECGAAGVGQSSWGPAVYGIVDGDVEADRLAACAREILPDSSVVLHGEFAAAGATVTRAR